MARASAQRSVWVEEIIADDAPGKWIVTAWSVSPGEKEPHKHPMLVDETTTPKSIICLCRSWFRYKKRCSAMRAWMDGTLGREPD